MSDNSNEENEEGSPMVSNSNINENSNSGNSNNNSVGAGSGTAGTSISLGTNSEEEEEGAAKAPGTVATPGSVAAAGAGAAAAAAAASAASSKSEEEEEVAGAEAAEAEEGVGEEGELDLSNFFQLGDSVLIESTLYGGPVMGTIYYRSLELLRILPLGVPNRLYNFRRDPDAEEFLPEEGVTASYIVEKRKLESFVEQQNLRKGQTLEALKGGELLPTKYTVKEVDVENDAVVLEDETGVDERLEFGFVGIPLDAPFDILRIFAGPPEAAPLGAAAAEEGAEAGNAGRGVVPQGVPEPIEADLTNDDGSPEEGVEAGAEAGVEGAEAAAGAGAAVADDPFADFEVEEVVEVLRPKVKVYEEAKESEKLVSDSVQKIDALNDFLHMFDPEKQRNPKIIRSVRLLVESLYNLKQDITEYNSDGTIKGVRRIAPAMLRDLQEMTHVPLSRTVLDIRKRVYAEEEEVAEAAAEAKKATKSTLALLTGEGEEEEGEEGESTGGAAGAGAGTTTVPVLPSGGRKSGDILFYRSQMADLAQQVSKGQDRMSRSVATIAGEVGKSIAFYVDEQGDYRTFERPWLPATGIRGGVNYTPLADTDFFRCELPEIEEPGNLRGYLPTFDKKGEQYPVVSDRLLFGMERALEQSYRKAEKGGVQILLGAEAAPMKDHLLFPQSVAPSVGATRSRSVAIDSGRSSMMLQSMLEVLEQLGGIKEGPSPEDIVVIKTEGETLGNLPINEYLEGFSTPGTGIGDTFTSLVELGLDTVELRADTLELLTNRLQAYQAQLVLTLNRLREGLAEQTASETAPVVHTLLGEDAWSPLQERIETNTILKKDLVALGLSGRTFLKSDIAKVVYLLRKHAELFQATLGGQPTIVAREEYRAVRDMYIESVEIGRLLNRKKTFQGAPPVPNKCEHVANLAGIRKLPDDSDKEFALMKFLTKYQGRRGEDDNWIYCNLCNKELLCVHERLQIQAFLNPKERETLMKQINIHFSGGVFQGNYICKHCGQPIQEIGYDTHLQFDDEGKPMSGRAELVDKDALRQEELEMATSAFEEASPDLYFKNADDRVFYGTLKELANRLGLPLKKETYVRLVGFIGSYMAQVTRESYDAQQASIAKAAAAAGRKPGKTPSFESVYAMTLVALAGALLLIEVQTTLREYEIKTVMPGCVASFLGYPMAEDKEDVRGATYVACAIASVGKNAYPWKDTGYQGISKIEDRRTTVLGRLVRLLTVLRTVDNPIKGSIDELYKRKKRHLDEIYGKGATGEALPVDHVPAGFLPNMAVPATKAEAAGAEEGALVPEAVRPDDPLALAQAWIQYGNMTARKSSNPVLGSPYSEITCCKANVTAPGAFWSSLGASLPALPPRTVGQARQPTLLQTPFFPRPLEPFEAEVPADLTYRLFLKVCYTGDRVGEPHEPGLDNQCAWCGLQFPTHPSLMTDAEGKDAIAATPEIETGPAEFQSLLNQVHTLNEVPPYLSPTVPTQEATLERLKTLNPPPSLTLPEDRLGAPWPAFVDQLIGEVRGLRREGVAANAPYALDEIAGLRSILGLSTLNEELRQQIVRSFQTALNLRSNSKPEAALLLKLQGTLESITSLSWSNLCQILETYMVVPFQRILSDYRPETLFLPVELVKELSTQHVTLLNEKILDPNMVIPVRYREQFKTLEALEATARLYRFVDQVRGIVRLRSTIRPMFMPGGLAVFNHLQSFLFYAPLYVLLAGPSPIGTEYMVQAQMRLERIGAEEEEGGGGEAGAGSKKKKTTEPPKAIPSADRLLCPLLRDTFLKQQAEQLNYNDEQIKVMIEDRSEREKQHMIGNIKNMSDDERMVEMRNMRLGLGKYAVGGTAKIYKYDAEQFDIEQQDWKASGIEVFSGRDPLAEGDMPMGDIFDENAPGEGYDHEGNGEFEGEDD